MDVIGTISSLGGPLTFCSEHLAEKWMGIHGKSISDKETDYQMASNVASEIGFISSASGCYVIIGDEPDHLYAIKDNEDILLVRWRWGLNEEEFLSGVRDFINKNAGFSDNFVYEADSSESIIFDSSGFARENEIVRISTSAGSYQVSSAHWTPNEDFCALIHRFSPIRSQENQGR